MFLAAADIVLFFHLLVIIFIVGGFFAISAGIMLRKRWVKNFRFRITHLAAIIFVVAETWLEKLCPLTDLENWLRQKGGSDSYGRTFVSYWFDKIIYHDLDFLVFQVSYSVFGLLVILQWIVRPPVLPFPKNKKGC